jgi:uncharacterized membrane protein
MGIGPVEYMVVAFPENRFTGDIAPALADLVEAGTIRIIDLAFVGKDTDGTVTAFELGDLESEVGAAFSKIVSESGGLLNDEDVEAVAEELEPNSSAALLVWEDVWATKIADAIRAAGGELWDLERVPHEVVQAAVEWSAEN